MQCGMDLPLLIEKAGAFGPKIQPCSHFNRPSFLQPHERFEERVCAHAGIGQTSKFPRGEGAVHLKWKMKISASKRGGLGFTLNGKCLHRSQYCMYVGSIVSYLLI